MSLQHFIKLVAYIYN